MSWVKAINRPLQYQKLLLRINAEQEVIIDGILYRLIPAR